MTCETAGMVSRSTIWKQAAAGVAAHVRGSARPCACEKDTLRPNLR
jgi:hypothetical protein